MSPPALIAPAKPRKHAKPGKRREEPAGSPAAALSPPRRPALPIARSAIARSGLLDFLPLFKPRIAVFVALATAAGFVLGAGSALQPVLLLHAMAATALLSAAASALNQLMERREDGRMVRTMGRPLPAGLLRPGEALLLGLGLAAAGLWELWGEVNGLTALLGAATLAGYLFAYTPLKRRTPLSTLVGGVPGALPPVMGWTAARNDLGPEALALFAILYLWQIPHFLAIARLHRDDYARAGFRVLTVIDPDGSATGRAIILNCAALVPASLLPGWIGLTGAASFFLAAVLGLGFLAFGVDAALRKGRGPARRLLIASLLYLPALLALFMLDKA